MAIIRDPEGNETQALDKLIDFKANEVLEIGCGDGRLTWRYAEKVGHITAIDQNTKAIATARENIPARLVGRVDFVESTIVDFVQNHRGPLFDFAIFSWSL